MRSKIGRVSRLALALAAWGVVLAPSLAFAVEEAEVEQPPLNLPSTGIAASKPIRSEASAVVNFTELARREALSGVPPTEFRPWMPREFEPPPEPVMPFSPSPIAAPRPILPMVASPSPTQSFIGLDDIAMVDSSYIVIPPDVGGAVGLTKVMSGHNNNYRIFDKATGAVLSTVGTATFWAPVVAANERVSLTDPRTVYDPYNNRWIVAMQTVTSGAGKLLIGVSQTSDPSGSWFLYSFNSAATVDYPILGFNKNWISMSINRYSVGGAFQRGINLVVNYPSARAGTGTGTLFTLATGTGFCASPCVTYSPASESLYVVTHLTSSSATYTLDWISGTAAAPVYNAGGVTLTRTGGGWAQPGGNQMPQSAPNAGASACGATPCPIESQDAQVRSAPAYRGGLIYYAQTVGLPSGGLTHSAVQWTKITTAGSPPAGTFVDGGRIEDATATATNGGKWYDNVHIAANALGDFIVGYTQFSSAQHPSAGYSYHDHADGAGTIRDPIVYKAGEDYYHKTFTTATGRNRWGDFSSAQVDPSDDASLWTLQEYGKTRPGTDDGNTGSNSSRWSTFWAKTIGPVPTATIAAGPSLNEGDGGTTPFLFTVNLSSSYALPVTVNYQTADGTATTANNDYQAATSSIVIPVGSTSGTITVLVNGDTNAEPNETFSVSLTGATNATVGAPGASTATIVNDDVASFTITASVGPNGTISPSGAVVVAQGANQTFDLTPNACFTVADVLVDGVSAGAVTAFTFTNVTANHTIVASFTAIPPAIGAVTGLTAAQVTAGNDGDGSTKIALGLTAPAGAASVEVWRAGFGGYPTYDGGGGAVPPLPGSYPPAGWTLTGVTASGQTDEPTSRDFWYYVAYAKDACGNVSPVSSMSAGTLDYHLGDIGDGLTPGQGDNKVTTADVSLLGAHYGDSGGALSGFEYIDVGPTTDLTTSGRPTTDAVVDFEDLVMFSLNYTPQVSLAVKAPIRALAANELTVHAPVSVTAGEAFDASIELSGAGDLQALSVALAWDAGRVEPMSAATGPLVTSLGGVMFSPGPGRADAAVLGAGARGMAGEGVVATVQFRALASGDPGISIHRAIGRDASNHPVAIAVAIPVSPSRIAATGLFPVIPNPSHGEASIDYALATRGTVELSVYSVDGRLVKSLVHGVQGVGRYRMVWSGIDDRGALAKSGIYFIRFVVAGQQTSRLVTLVR